MMPPYVAGPHPWADKLVFRYFSNGFGQLTFVSREPSYAPIRRTAPCCSARHSAAFEATFAKDPHRLGAENGAAKAAEKIGAATMRL